MSATPGMPVKTFARARAVPPSTVFAAIEAGYLHPLPDGRIDPAEADAWLEGHRARAERVAAGTAGRQRRLDAAAISAMSSIARLRRELAELRRTTAPREAAEGAYARRKDRLQAALTHLPGLCTPVAAEALQRPPRAVAAALQRFAEALAGELGDLRAPPATEPLIEPGRTETNRGSH